MHNVVIRVLFEVAMLNFARKIGQFLHVYMVLIKETLRFEYLESEELECIFIEHAVKVKGVKGDSFQVDYGFFVEFGEVFQANYF